MNATKHKVADATTITAYKGFDRDMKCRGFQFEVGKTYEHEGNVEACESGFHACEYPLDVFNYYPPSTSRFAVVNQAGDLSRKGSDSKVASSFISIVEMIDLECLVKKAIEYTTSRCKTVDENATPSATGDRGAASATGNQGAASATGYRGAASVWGDRGAASVWGDRGAASVWGDQGAASATGDRGAASATGNQGAASATGDRGAASATGYQGAASATGNRGAASATGYQGAASATGYRGAASATGDRGAASATGVSCIAISSGQHGLAKAAEGCAIVLVSRALDGSIAHIRASKAGENGIKPDVWYSLDENGEFVEVSE